MINTFLIDTDIVSTKITNYGDFMKKVECEHMHGTVPHWDHSTCKKCGWVIPYGQHRGPNNGFFPSMDALLEFDKFKFYPGMNEIKPKGEKMSEDCNVDEVIEKTDLGNYELNGLSPAQAPFGTFPSGSFLAKLEELINCHSIENGSNTPDFILAEYLRGCLDNFNICVRRREEWYHGRKEVGSSSVAVD